LRHAAALAVGGGLAVVVWLIVYRSVALINPRDLPTFDVLRTGPMGLSLIASEAVTLLAPLTGSFVAYRSSAAAIPPESFLSQNLQVVFSTVLQYVVVAGGLAWLFVRPRQWSHWLGMVTLPALYIGGVVLGVSVYRTYDANPGLSGRYGLALAPLLVLGLVGSLRSRASKGAVGALAVSAVGLSFYFMLAA
jgi:hypothetical protein